MQDQVNPMACEVELKPGERLTLPPDFVASVGPGRWMITALSLGRSPTRRHDAFLSSYAPEDEGLYDDAPTR